MSVEVGIIADLPHKPIPRQPNRHGALASREPLPDKSEALERDEEKRKPVFLIPL
jgi:hypothetical protein